MPVLSKQEIFLWCLVRSPGKTSASTKSHSPQSTRLRAICIWACSIQGVSSDHTKRGETRSTRAAGCPGLCTPPAPQLQDGFAKQTPVWLSSAPNLPHLPGLASSRTPDVPARLPWTLKASAQTTVTSHTCPNPQHPGYIYKQLIYN